MKVLLIQPSRLLPDGTVYKSPRRWLLGMTLPYVAALTPPGIDVSIKDDLYDEITFDEDCDLVGISFMSHQAPRAYQLADGFRKRGKTVVMGGFHVTLAPEEASEHCDAYVWGEAEGAWPQLLEDFQAGRLTKRYQSEKLSDLKNLPVPRYDLIDLKRYKIPNIPAQTTRGCPYGCNYCEVTQVYGGKYRFRPVDEVIDEVTSLMKMTKRKFIYFVDDLFIANRKHAIQIMERLLPLKMKWTCLATANVGDDPEILDLMKKTGCVHINIGMESISPESLRAVNKKQNKVSEYKRQFKEIRKRGIEFSLNVMFGLDGDRPEVFDSTLEVLKESKAPMSFIFILAPRVGTKIREQLLGEDRILHDDWTRYCGYECVFKPKHMTIEELEEGFWRVHREFYSIRSIFKRLYIPPKSYTWYSTFTNLVFRWGAKRRIHPLTYY